MRRLVLAPSILAADFANLGSQINDVERSGAEYLHADVMDGHFVPNISIGPPVIASVRCVTKLTIDAHLMIENPGRYVFDFIQAGADIINIHAEACEPGPVLKTIKAAGKKAGLTINPSTSADVIFPFIDELDLVLVMSVEPGFGGQKLIPDCLKKAHKLADYIEKHNLVTDLEMDGGINILNVGEVISSGVNVIVAGSAIFGAVKPGGAVRDFMDIFSTYGIKYTM